MVNQADLLSKINVTSLIATTTWRYLWHLWYLWEK